MYDKTEAPQDIETLDREIRELTRLLESSQDVFYRTDLEGRLTFITPSIERYAGYAPSELIGRFAHEVYADPEDRNKFIEELYRTGSVIDYGVRLVDRSGEIHFVSVNARAVSENGELAGVEGVMRDITRRKKLELAMVEDISESRKFQQEREAMIVELQAALANVKTLSGLLPMCSWCKKIRDDRGSWSEVEVFVKQRSDADFTHGICPDCQNEVRKGFGMGSKDKDTDK